MSFGPNSGLPPLPPLDPDVAAANRRGSRRAILATVVVALLAVGGVSTAAILAGDEEYSSAIPVSGAPYVEPAATTGLTDEEFDCRQVDFVSEEVDEEGESTAELRYADCGWENAVYIVYQRLTGSDAGADCPRGDYVEYFSVGSSSADTPFKECLGYNMRAGECFFVDGNEGVERTDCKAPHEPSTTKVVKVIDGGTPKSCAKLNAVALQYSKPARVMCTRPLS